MAASEGCRVGFRGTASLLAFVAAAIVEIAGCFAFWGWLRMGKPVLWIVPGIGCLGLFAYLLTLVDTANAERAYAAYGGIDIATSLAWQWVVEGVRPDRWDIIGSAVCLVGAAIIMYGPRTAAT